MVINVLDVVNMSKKIRHIDKMSYIPQIGEIIKVSKVFDLSFGDWQHFQEETDVQVCGYKNTLNSTIHTDPKGLIGYIAVKRDLATWILPKLSLKKAPEFQWSHSKR